jgi:hypothetical protein
VSPGVVLLLELEDELVVVELDEELEEIEELNGE